MTTDSNRIFSDVRLIRNRHVRFSQKERLQLELLCEDKVSKHKLEEIHSSLPSSIKSTFIMTFSPDGQRVASTHGDHRIYICDLNTGKLLDTLEGHPKTPWCLAWHPSNGEILASGCLAGEVRVWDLRSKACDSWTSENHTIISSLDFHPKERVLVIATANDILFWDWSESEPFAKTTTLHDREKVKFVVFDSSGTKLITGISNLPKYAGFSSDSLQSRIIDGYLSQGTIESLPTENMTESSEITTSPVVGSTINSAENLSGRNTNSTSPSRGTNPSVINVNTDINNSNSDNINSNNEQDINNRNTMLLSRVANLYRQLESLEDSLRHTSFAPMMNIRPVENSSSTESSDVSSATEVVIRNCQPNIRADRNIPSNQHSFITTGNNQSSGPPTNDVTSQDRPASLGPLPATPIANTFEPYLVAFDEFLEQLQLPTLIMDGRSVDLTTVMNQYPVDLSRQVHHAMQFESINQVNQNFIRISKLMSSARLYRQVVQQITSNSSGNGPLHQPNQVLIAQSVSPRSPRHSPNIPIVLRNYSLANSTESEGLTRQNRSHDPIMAIEFRNAARNVPLTTICKIDLLAARAICILHSQHLIEQALVDSRTQAPGVDTPDNNNRPRSNAGSSTGSTQASSPGSNPALQSILAQLHSTLTMINHAPLTTSNAYAHITSLRVILENLTNALSSTLRSPDDGRRLSELMHNIAFSLTGRRWSVPLGATLNEIRLDVIHTLCIVDLALHFVRQIQLLQMTRVSLIARVEESRRPSTATTAVNSSPHPTVVTGAQMGSSQQVEPVDGSPSLPGTSGAKLSGASKRKNSDPKNELKRLRSSDHQSTMRSDIAMDTIEARSNVTNETANSTASPSIDSAPVDQNSAADRMIIWNSPQSQIEQSLQRFLVTTTSSMSNSHILVRVYHRPHGMSRYPMADPLLERSSPQVESRRRALSQDNSIDPQEQPIDVIPGNVPVTRHRVRPPTAYQVNMIPHGSNQPQAQPGGGQTFDAWQRNPHVHMYQTRGPGQHLWFNQWTIPLPMNNSNFRLQCWNFSRASVPDIKDSQLNVITHKCRIHNDSSVDLSSDGSLLACLVPRDDGHSCFPGFELKIFSLKSHDFGSCYYKLLQGHNALSVSLSPSGKYAVVGLATHKSINYEQSDDDLKIGKVFKLSGGSKSLELIRDIKVKRDDTSFCLNAIKWMPRGIVYSVGPQHLQRYQAARMRNVVAS